MKRSRILFMLSCPTYPEQFIKIRSSSLISRTNTYPENWNKSSSKGLNALLPDVQDCSLCYYRHIQEIVVKILLSVMLLTDRQSDKRTNRQTDRQTKEQRWKMNFRFGSAYLEIIDCARAVEIKNGGMDTFNTPKYWELYSAFRV